MNVCKEVIPNNLHTAHQLSVDNHPSMRRLTQPPHDCLHNTVFSNVAERFERDINRVPKYRAPTVVLRFTMISPGSAAARIAIVGNGGTAVDSTTQNTGRQRLYTPCGWRGLLRGSRPYNQNTERNHGLAKEQACNIMPINLRGWWRVEDLRLEES